MTDSDYILACQKIAHVYYEKLEVEHFERISKSDINLTKTQNHEVIHGLLARQITLVSGMVKSLPTWNEHIAPIILRCIIDATITLKYIYLDVDKHVQQFVDFGLGQETLMLKRIKERNLAEDGEIINQIEQHINKERKHFLNIINVGSWNFINIRETAIKAQCKELYDFAYSQFSIAAHSSWNFIFPRYLEYCKNPLHKYHRVPVLPELEVNYIFLIMAADHLKQSLSDYDKLFFDSAVFQNSFDYLVTEFKNIHEDVENS